MTKYLYLYNLHCYNASLISIELQTEKWQITSICKGLLSKYLQEVSLFVRLFLAFLFNQKGQRSTILQAQKTHKFLYIMCVFRINVKTKYTDLKIKPKYVQVCVSVQCHFTNVFASPISGEMNGEDVTQPHLTSNISIFKYYNLLSKWWNVCQYLCQYILECIHNFMVQCVNYFIAF